MWGSDANLDDFSEGVEFKGFDPFLCLLEPGQTLIMRRPITIHSSVTVKDTLMDCGCFWRYDSVLQSTLSTAWELRNHNTTNEDPAFQLLPILETILEWLKDLEYTQRFGSMDSARFDQAVQVCLQEPKHAYSASANTYC